MLHYASILKRFNMCVVYLGNNLYTFVFSSIFAYMYVEDCPVPLHQDIKKINGAQWTNQIIASYIFAEHHEQICWTWTTYIDVFRVFVYIQLSVVNHFCVPYFCFDDNYACHIFLVSKVLVHLISIIVTGSDPSNITSYFCFCGKTASLC